MKYLSIIVWLKTLQRDVEVKQREHEGWLARQAESSYNMFTQTAFHRLQMSLRSVRETSPHYKTHAECIQTFLHNCILSKERAAIGVPHPYSLPGSKAHCVTGLRPGFLVVCTTVLVSRTKACHVTLKCPVVGVLPEPPLGQ